MEEGTNSFSFFFEEKSLLRFNICLKRKRIHYFGETITFFLVQSLNRIKRNS